MKNLKEFYVQIRLTEKEKKTLQQKANKEGMTLAQYIRTKCIYN